METITPPIFDARLPYDQADNEAARMLEELVRRINELPGDGPLMRPVFEATSPHTQPASPEVVGPSVYDPAFTATPTQRTEFAYNAAHLQDPAYPNLGIPAKPFVRGNVARRPPAGGRTSGHPTTSQSSTGFTYLAASEYPRSEERREDGTVILEGPTTYTVIQPRLRLQEANTETHNTERRRGLLARLGGFATRVAIASTVLFPVIDTIANHR